MKTVENVVLDEERALYGSKDLLIRNVKFDGPADGESAVKECSNLIVENCFCNLRYPFWHVDGLAISGTEMTELCRAALWYSHKIVISDCKMLGIKALRECSEIKIGNCDVVSPEFGWFVHGLEMADSTVHSEYFLMRSSDLKLQNVKFHGKYSFQYVQNVLVENCELDTKDAFWHAHNVVVKNCFVKGEYLGWYSDGLTFIDCTIQGTQPLCYCKNLKLVNCKMVDTDLCFEKSDVNAEITTPVVSIKNVHSGTVIVPQVGDIICDDENAHGKIVTGGKSFSTKA